MPRPRPSPRGEHELLPLGPSSAEDDNFELDLESELRHEIGQTDEAGEMISHQAEPREQLPPELAKTVWYKKPGCVYILAGLLLAIVLVIMLVNESPSSAEPERVYANITKSPSDPRSYRYLQLEANSLPVLLISDTAAEKASAAMSVGTGSSSDPRDRQGLAHFLEHMLFMGSKQWPLEDEYGKFLQAHGGRSNAFTAEEETNYFFEVQASAGILDNILSRFSGFFSSPLLSPSGVSREINAVESEHRKNVRNDGWRNWAILHRSAAADSAFRHFGTGTISTLNHSSIVEDLRTFWTEHYTAKNMKLVITGQEGLDELEALARLHFSAVPGVPLPAAVVCEAKELTPLPDLSGQSSRHPSQLLAVCDSSVVAAPFSSSTLPWTDVETGQIWTFVPSTSPSHNLNLYWATPSDKWPFGEQFTGKPLEYLSYMIGHEGSEFTLCSALKRSNLAVSVSVGLEVTSGRFNQSLFSVAIKLTDLGNQLANRQLVLERVYEYIAMLRALPLVSAEATPKAPSHQTYFENMQAEATVRWNFKERESPIDYTSALASRMNSLMPFGLPIRDILLPPSIFSFGTGEAITKALPFFKAENMIIVYSSSDLVDATAAAAIAPADKWAELPFYGFPYVSQPIAAEVLTKIQTAVAATATKPSGMELPPPVNAFLPTDFTIIDWQGYRDAVQAEVNAEGDSGSKAHPAADQLRGQWATFDPKNNVPIQLPLATPTNNTLYFKPDIVFLLPYAYVSTLIRTAPGFLSDPANDSLERQVQFQLWISCMAEVVAPLQYQLSQVGSSLHLTTHPARVGLIVGVKGFSNKLDTVWRQLLALLTDLSSLTPERFVAIKQTTWQSIYANWPTERQPYEHALNYMQLWEESTRSSMEESDAQFQSTILVDTYTLESLGQFVDSMFDRIGLQTYAYGNLNVTTAHAFQDALGKVVSGGRSLELTGGQRAELKLADKDVVYRRSTPATVDGVVVPVSNSSFIFKHAVLNPAETNSAIILNLQVTNTGPSCEMVLLMLVHQLMGSETFNVLRTQESLGYIVTSRMRDAAGMGLNSVRSYEFIIQSDRLNPILLEQRIEHFIRTFANSTLSKLTDEELSQQKSTLAFAIDKTRRASLSMSANFNFFWTAKISRDLATPYFDDEDRLLKWLDAITKPQLIDFFAAKLLDPSRRKLVVSVFGSQFNSSMSADADLANRDPDLARRVTNTPLDSAQRSQRGAGGLDWTFSSI